MSSENILLVQNLNVSFDNFRVLNDLNFSINRGELRFLIGPNGAGKTTLLDIVTRKTKADSGRVLYDGKVDISRWLEHKIVRGGIARKFQTPSIFSSLTVAENLEVAAGFRLPKYKLVRSISGEEHEWIEDILGKIGLKEKANQEAAFLSHGQKQWLEIGMLLTQKPKLLLLDEPVAGMSRAERDRTGELLQGLSGECAILVVEHDMVFMRQFASMVTVMHMGKVLAEGTVDHIQNNPEVIEVYLGHNQRATA
jgi:urea transport system ATP-binding protein